MVDKAFDATNPSSSMPLPLPDPVILPIHIAFQLSKEFILNKNKENIRK